MRPSRIADYSRGETVLWYSYDEIKCQKLSYKILRIAQKGYRFFFKENVRKNSMRSKIKLKTTLSAGQKMGADDNAAVLLWRGVVTEYVSYIFAPLPSKGGGTMALFILYCLSFSLTGKSVCEMERRRRNHKIKNELVS